MTTRRALRMGSGRVTGAWAAVLGLSVLSLAAALPAAAAQDDPQVARGAYLVTAGGCNDCHTPLVMGPGGPEPDMSRMLSGHPASMALPPPPPLPEGPWNWVGTGTLTAFAGPWGVSYARNLTPDKATGLGGWTEAMFVQTIRTGRHMGTGRPLLPPMPWPWAAKYSDDDLKAIFAYLRSIPAVKNRVPDPVPPAAAPKAP
jgi:mono/diheme cytochrome c family protein